MDAFSPGKVLGRSLSLWGRWFIPFVALAVLVQLPVIVLVAIAPESADSRGVSVVSTFLDFVVTGALTTGVLRALDGHSPRLGEMARAGLAKLWRVLGASILSGLAVGLGLLALVVPGILLACAVAVAVPAAVAEGLSASDAISRSFELTKGSRVGVFLAGLGIVAFVVLVAGAGVAALTVGGEVAGASPAGLAVLEQLLAQVVGTAFAVALAVTYHELRVRKDGVPAVQVAQVFE